MTATTRTTRRDNVKPGDIFQSSHGYRLLVTEVLDDAPNRIDSRNVQISGFLHANPSRSIVTERYPAGSTVEVELTDDEINLQRPALLALVRWVGEQGLTVPLELHAQCREALGDDFYRAVESRMSDQALADHVNAIYDTAGSGGLDEDALIEAENEIAGRLELDPSETEQDLTVEAHRQINEWVDRNRSAS